MCTDSQLWSRWCQPQVIYTTKSFSIIFPLGTLGWSWKGLTFCFGTVCTLLCSLSMDSSHELDILWHNCDPSCMWMAHKFVSSKSPTRYASHASCSPIIAETWILISEFVCHRILYTSLRKGCFLISKLHVLLVSMYSLSMQNFQGDIYIFFL